MTIWFPTTKSQESPQFPYVEVVCHILLKSLWWKLQFWFKPHLNRRFSHKVMGPQSCGSPNFGNFKTPLRVSGQNDIWLLVPWPSAKYIIKGEVMTSPKSRPWWVLWVRVCLWFVRAQKCSNYTLTKWLFGLCRFVWVIEFIVNIPNPILEL